MQVEVDVNKQEKKSLQNGQKQGKIKQVIIYFFGGNRYA